MPRHHCNHESRRATRRGSKWRLAQLVETIVDIICVTINMMSYTAICAVSVLVIVASVGYGCLRLYDSVYIPPGCAKFADLPVDELVVMCLKIGWPVSRAYGNLLADSLFQAFAKVLMAIEGLIADLASVCTKSSIDEFYRQVLMSAMRAVAQHAPNATNITATVTQVADPLI